MITKTQNLQDLRQWLCWRIEERDGRPTKIPYSPFTGGKASTTDPETWAGYSEAVKAYRERDYDGIGFVFCKDDPFCGVDLDGCLSSETGEIELWAKELIEHLGSYTELSPSGTGIHVLVKADLPPGGRRKDRIEMYDRGRFFTITGRHLPGTPKTIVERQAEVEALHRRLFGTAQGDTNGRVSRGPGNGLSDTEILARAKQASNGEAFE